MVEENYLYYRRGNTVAGIMLKGAIHPDMHEDNFGKESNILVDFGSEVKFYEFPDELDENKVRQLTEALFPPTEKIVKSFEKMSWFRAGFIGWGGELAAAVFSNAARNNISSFPYCKAIFDKREYDISEIFSVEAKNRLREWKHFICNDLLDENTRNIDYAAVPVVLEKTQGRNRYYIELLVMISAVMTLEAKSNELMSVWLTALHFACRSIEMGYIYTGYGILRKVLHWCGQAYIPIVQYHAKIEEMLEGYKLRQDIKDFIEESTKYDFMEFLWIVNDIDTFVA